MKIKLSTYFIVAYILMFFLHFFIWEMWVKEHQLVFLKYYLFLTFLYMMVLTILSILERIYPQYIGFGFMGLVMFKLAIMFLVMKKLDLQVVEGYKLHFIPPYLLSLVLETLYAVRLLNAEKNH